MHSPNLEFAMIRSHIVRLKGFALIEAMIAGLVMAFGMLAMVSMQMSISRNADLSKARVEATRLAQEKMEELRSYTAISPLSATATWATEQTWDTLASAADTDTKTTTNTTYGRTWSLSAATGPDAMRTALVTVSWTDLMGNPHSVRLSSVISKTDPADSGYLAFPLPQNTNLKRPMNRNVNIPIPAVDLGDGKSGYQITRYLAVVFSNDSGAIIQKCTWDQPTLLSADTDLSSCQQSSALMVAGYISRAGNSGAWPTGINYAGVSSVDSSNIICKYGDAVDQTTGVTLSNYKYYLCIIPVSSQTDPPSTWSGTIRLGGLPDTSSSSTYVCRYQYTDTSLSSNARNVQPYSNVTDSLDNQDYIIGSGTANCSTESAIATTILHQDCHSTNANHSVDCPAASANNY